MKDSAMFYVLKDGEKISEEEYDKRINKMYVRIFKHVSHFAKNCDVFFNPDELNTDGCMDELEKCLYEWNHDEKWAKEKSYMIITTIVGMLETMNNMKKIEHFDDDEVVEFIMCMMKWLITEDNYGGGLFLEEEVVKVVWDE